MTPAGFPHSEILGSQLGRQLPEAYRAPYVLLRLLVPRHPPCALINLATKMLASLCSSQGTGDHTEVPSRTPLRRRSTMVCRT